MGLEYRCDCCGNTVDEGYARLTVDEPRTIGYEEFDFYLCEFCKRTFKPILETFLAYKEKKFVLVKA